MKKDDFVLSASWDGLKEWAEAVVEVFKSNWNFLSFMWGLDAGMWFLLFLGFVLGNNPGIIDYLKSGELDAPSFLCGTMAGLIVTLVIVLLVFNRWERTHK